MKKVLLALAILMTSMSSHAMWKDVPTSSVLAPSLDLLIEKGALEQGRYFFPDVSAEGAFVNKVFVALDGKKQSVRDDATFTNLEGLDIILDAFGREKDVVPTSLFRRKVTGFTKDTTSLLQSAMKVKLLTLSEASNFAPNETLTRRNFARWIARMELPKPRQEVRFDAADKKQTLNKGIFDALVQQLDMEYVYENAWKEKREKAIEDGFEALVRGLDDPYTRYVPTSESEEFWDRLSGELVGIGAVVEIHDEKFVVVSPLRDTPAERAGLLPKDWITHVDGQATEGESLQAVVRRIKGQEGTTVKLTVQRGNSVLEKEIIRAKINVPTLTWKVHKNYVVVEIHQFSFELRDMWKVMLADPMFPENPSGIIIDVRNNSGGVMEQVLYVAEEFVNEGNVIVYEKRKVGEIEYAASRTGRFVDMKNILVLQNAGSASASEILASGLRELRGAQILGTVSFGKGTVQTVMTLQGGGVFKFTRGEWYTPERNQINKVGIQPDVVFENTSTRGGRDELMEYALRILQQR